MTEPTTPTPAPQQPPTGWPYAGPPATAAPSTADPAGPPPHPVPTEYRYADVPPGPAWQPVGWPPVGMSAPPQPRPRRRRRLVLIAAAAAVIAVVAAVISTAHRAPATPIAAPNSFGSFHRLNSDQADRVAKTMRSMGSLMGSGAGKFVNAATIASYADSGAATPSLVILVGPRDTPGIPADADPQTIVDGMLSGTAPHPESFPTGPHGGAMSCTTPNFGTLAETMCAWSDKQTIGLLVSIAPPLRPAAAADATRALRDAIDS